MPPTAATAPAPAAADPDSWKSHPAAKVLLQQQTVAQIRVSIHKDFWPELRGVTSCPGPIDDDTPGPDQALWPRVIGTVKKWSKKQEALRMVWYDGEQSNDLKAMTDEDYGLRLAYVCTRK